MGEILEAKCPCGFKAKDLFVGCGMNTMSTLGSCKRCGSLGTISQHHEAGVVTSFSGNLGEAEECKRCGRILTPMDYDAEKVVGCMDPEPEYKLGDITGLKCPRCEKDTLLLFGGGIWD